MKLTLESTQKVVTVNGVQTRIWEGKSESGVPVHCFIARVGVAKDQDCSQFEKELTEHRAPSAEVKAIPLRLIL